MPGIMLNIDNTHFFATRSADEMTEEGVDELVDVYRDTAVTELAFCVAGRRTRVHYDAWGWEPVWTNLEEWEQRGISDHIENTILLRDRGVDPFERWLARCREVGIGGWLSIRANDVHHTCDPDHPIHPQFWKDRPDLWRRPYDFERNVDRALDYAKEEVRERLVGFVEELAGRYEMDGLEIDWMRRPWTFAPGREGEGALRLTEMMAEIRKILRSRDIALGVRVPPTPEDSRGFGLDAVQWAKLGIVDRIAPCPDMQVNGNLPVDRWKDAVDGTGVPICPGVNAIVRPYHRYNRMKDGNLRRVNVEILRGLAAALLHRGADQVYFFNVFDRKDFLSEWEEDAYRRLMSEAGDVSGLESKPRRHILTYNDVPAPGTSWRCELPAPCGPCGNMDPWADLAIPDTAELRVYTGPVSDDLTAQVRLAFEGATRRYGHRLYIPKESTVRLNGQVCEFAGPAEIDEPTPDEDLWTYSVPDGAMGEGYNVIEVLPTRATSIQWAELAWVEKPARPGG